MARPIITLTTDFGTADTFVGAMKGVILEICPEAAIVDLTHEIPPQDIRAAAYVFETAYAQFPPGTVHLIVVDPGVGTNRRAIAVQSADAFFVCPDNGVLSHLVDREAGGATANEPFAPLGTPLPAGWAARQLTNRRYWREPVSNTFHGRDLFAPVAAHIASGELLEVFGPAIDEITAFAVPHAQATEDGVVGVVLHVDRFGNLITNIEARLIADPGAAVIEVSGREIRGLSRSYQDGNGQDGDALVGLIGSNGCLEIAVPNGNAATALDGEVGLPVVVRER
jgi:S-adenosylmethionine hydrolase